MRDRAQHDNLGALRMSSRSRETNAGRPTSFAQAVWQLVRNRQCRKQKFRREYPIPLYTVDFCCVALKLIIEIDGQRHQTEEGRAHDKRRDDYLAGIGYQLLRIPGFQVLRDVVGDAEFIDRRQHLGAKSSNSVTPYSLAGTIASAYGFVEVTPNRRYTSNPAMVPVLDENWLISRPSRRSIET